MTKLSILVALALIWFMVAGIIIAPKETIESWMLGGVVYLGGLYWVIPFILNKKMYAPYTADDLPPTRKNLFKRLLLFSIGFLISVCSSMTP